MKAWNSRWSDFQDMERTCSPQVMENWRFQQALYRTYFDAFVRRRLIRRDRTCRTGTQPAGTYHVGHWLGSCAIGHWITTRSKASERSGSRAATGQCPGNS